MATGCNSFLYYPTRGKYVNPEKLKFPPEEIEVNSGNGQKLVGWLFRAQKEPNLSQERPTILFFHGNGQNLSAHFLGLYWVLEKDYDFLIFDYPGYGGSEGEPNQSNTVESGHLFYQWIKQHRPGPIVIFGQSLGGAVALQVAQQLHQDENLCLVAVDSTFASYQKAARKTLARHWFSWPIQWLAWLTISDKEAPEDHISKISPKPLVVIHGKKDEVVSYELGEEVFELAKEPKEFWPVDEAGHIQAFQDRQQGREIKQKFLTQMQKYCVPKSEVADR